MAAALAAFTSTVLGGQRTRLVFEGGAHEESKAGAAGVKRVTQTRMSVGCPHAGQCVGGRVLGRG